MNKDNELQFLCDLKQFCTNRSLYNEIDILTSIISKIKNYDELQDRVMTLELKLQLEYM